MLLLRYQRQRQLENEESAPKREHSEIDMRRKLNDRDLKGESHRAATRGTLICIFVCGSLLLSLGLTLLLAGLLVPKLSRDPTPWLVSGPTCIVLGILVLLLSVEIILKLRKISAGSEPSDSHDSCSKPGWGSRQIAEPETEDLQVDLVKDSELVTRIPVLIQPPTPLQTLSASSLPLAVPERP